MKYYVFRHTETRDHEVASCLYLDDAQAILARYYAGYIICDGKAVESKRVS